MQVRLPAFCVCLFRSVLVGVFSCSFGWLGLFGMFWFGFDLINYLRSATWNHLRVPLTELLLGTLLLITLPTEAWLAKNSHEEIWQLYCRKKRLLKRSRAAHELHTYIFNWPADHSQIQKPRRSLCKITSVYTTLKPLSTILTASSFNSV